MNKSLFLIAALPPENISAEILAIKNEMAAEFNVRHALKLPAHITLQRPFFVTEDQVELLHRQLAEFVRNQKPFSVHLKNFDRFDSRVIFIAISDHAPFSDLVINLQSFMPDDVFQNKNQRQTTIHPHISIATRDLDAHNFPPAWNLVKNRHYEANFLLEQICLFRHNGKHWERPSEFELNLNHR